MRNRRKRFVLAAAALMVIGLLLTGTGIMAYLTDAETMTNTFTIGEIKIDLVEPSWPGNHSDKVQNIEPNISIAKDPHIINTGNNNAFVFAKIWIPLREISVVNYDGTFIDLDNDNKPDKKAQEIFSLFKGGSLSNEGVLTGATAIDLSNLTEKDSPLNSGWVFIKSEMNVTNTNDTSDTTKYNVYTFGYNTKLTPEGSAIGSLDNDRTNSGNEDANEYTTTTLFDFVQLKNFIEGDVLKDDILKLHVSSYAIQAEYILDNEGHNVTDLTDIDNMKYVFNAYFNQNDDTETPDARGYYGKFNLEEQHNRYGIPQGLKADETVYTVTFWTQKETGDPAVHDEQNYEKHSTDVFVTKINTEVTPAVKTIDGYTSPAAETVTVSEHGASINYYYEKTPITYTVNAHALYVYKAFTGEWEIGGSSDPTYTIMETLTDDYGTGTAVFNESGELISGEVPDFSGQGYVIVDFIVDTENLETFSEFPKDKDRSVIYFFTVTDTANAAGTSFALDGKNVMFTVPGEATDIAYTFP